MQDTELEITVNPMPVLNGVRTFAAPRSPDKSMTHRALILASMADGDSIIRKPLMGEDCLAAKKAFEDCGVSFRSSTDVDADIVWHVHSPGLNHLHTPAHALDLGNSGTASRLLIGVFSGVAGLRCTIDGDASLRSRPMARVVDPLRNMGAEIAYQLQDNRLPLTITGCALYPRKHLIHVPSAQIKSAITFAALSAPGETLIELPSGSRDHTEKMLQHLGANVRSRQSQGTETINIVGPWRPPSFDCEIPNDPSSVAFFAALAAIHPGLNVTAERVICNSTRTGFYLKLQAMGADVFWEESMDSPRFFGEYVSNLRIQRDSKQRLLPALVEPFDVVTLIDEVPILAVVAAFAHGTSVFRGLRELRVKESDRLLEIANLLEAAGVEVKFGSDWLEVCGVGNKPVNAFSFGSEDHRLVMAAMILATRASGPSKIRGLSWINTSFPLFHQAFQNITSGIN